MSIALSTSSSHLEAVKGAGPGQLSVHMYFTVVAWPAKAPVYTICTELRLPIRSLEIRYTHWDKSTKAATGQIWLYSKVALAKNWSIINFDTEYFYKDKCSWTNVVCMCVITSLDHLTSISIDSSFQKMFFFNDVLSLSPDIRKKLDRWTDILIQK